MFVPSPQLAVAVVAPAFDPPPPEPVRAQVWAPAGAHGLSLRRAQPRLRELNDVAVKRHLEAAYTRMVGWGEAELAVGPQTEVCVREMLGDLAEKLEAIETKGRPSLTKLEVIWTCRWRCGVAELPLLPSSPSSWPR